VETILSNMPRSTQPPLPSAARALAAAGENLRLARLRRGLSVTLVAERAGMSRPTLRAVERGEPRVSIGAYANVLHCLGLEKELSLLAQKDELGRQLQDAALGGRRARRLGKEPSDGR
jgi:transcriptional regulator with XRE-family HTH domain